MDDRVYEIMSSRTRMKIADMVSARPRSLDELREATGISVQGVLKHLEKLKGLGLVDEIRVKSDQVSVRKVYGGGKLRFMDCSSGDLVIVSAFDAPSVGRTGEDRSLDSLAEDAVVQRLRLKEEARRMARLIDELEETEGRIQAALNVLELEDGERLIMQALYSEETPQEGEKLLIRHYGLKGGRRSIDKALAKAKRIVG